MGKITVTDDLLFHKSMRLESAGLVVDVTEANPYGKQRAMVEIYHSPHKFPMQDNFHVRLKNRAQLKDYIKMLTEFEANYGHLLDVVQKDEKK